MALINWSANLSVNIKEIDTQHQKWIEIINDLNDAMKAGKSKEILGDVFKRLIDYTKFHFKYEEDLFEKYGYMDKVSHKMLHQKLVNEVNGYYNDFKAGKMSVSIQLMQLLSNWLIDHIQKTDKGYSKYLNDKGVK